MRHLQPIILKDFKDQPETPMTQKARYLPKLLAVSDPEGRVELPEMRDCLSVYRRQAPAAQNIWHSGLGGRVASNLAAGCSAGGYEMTWTVQMHSPRPAHPLCEWHLLKAPHLCPMGLGVF